MARYFAADVMRSANHGSVAAWRVRKMRYGPRFVGTFTSSATAVCPSTTLLAADSWRAAMTAGSRAKPRPRSGRPTRRPAPTSGIRSTIASVSRSPRRQPGSYDLESLTRAWRPTLDQSTCGRDQTARELCTQSFTKLDRASLGSHPRSEKEPTICPETPGNTASVISCSMSSSPSSQVGFGSFGSSCGS